MVRERFPESHPTDEEIAAYLGHELSGEARRGVELHLAQCAACRQEVVDATEILKTPRRVHWRALAPVAAAAAVILLFISWPQGERPLTDLLPHRDSPAAAEVAPVPISPIGPTPEVAALVWNRVAGADQYRTTLYSAEGSVMWRETTTDSSVAVPDSISFQPGLSYLWKVEGRVGWDLWESSELFEFRVEGEANPVTPGEGSP